MRTVIQALAAGVRRSITTQLQRLDVAMSRLRTASAGAQRRWRQASTFRRLAELDDAMLRDLGMTRAEIGSVAAEAHAAAVHTRMRTVGSTATAGWS
jgi:uncharacterized protein YjiS (DUF1127 family)